VHDHIGLVQPMFVETLVGFEYERRRHDARGVSQHPILGHDRVSFNAANTYW
jgi:hypothetical protein